jgi:1-acyl-sn-glycerol-3-phosphate acyltransferase
MQAIRQYLVFEFLEKLFAALALLVGGPLTPFALLLLFGRRAAWRVNTPPIQQAGLLARREMLLLAALGLGLLLSRMGLSLGLDPAICSASLLVLASGATVLGERSAVALWPQWTGPQWTPKGLRHLAGWFCFGLVLASLAVRYSPDDQLMAVGIALISAVVPVRMAYHRGEPGLLPLAAPLLCLGIGLDSLWLSAAALGWLLPTGILIAHNLRISTLWTSLAATLGVLAATWLPAWGALAASLVLLGLACEFWRFIVRFALYFPLRAIHKFRVYHLDNAAADGPAIVVSNHVTLADGWLLGAMTQRMVRFLVFDAYYKDATSRFLLNLFRTIPIAQGARREAVESLKKARAVIESGHFAGIFPEGGITRSGHLHPFQKGFTRILAGTEIPIIPAYMNGLWTSFGSFSEQKVHFRLGRFFRPFEIEFGAPLPPSTTAPALWRAVKSLEVNAAFRDAHHASLLPVAFLESARRHARLAACQGPEGSLSYEELAGNALLLARHINHRLSRKARIGVFLPPGRERLLAQVALCLAGHVAMDIPELPAEAFEQWRARHGLGLVITSQAYAESQGCHRLEGMIFIGRALARAHSRAPFRDALYRWLGPARAFAQVCPFPMRKDSAAAIVTSSQGPLVLSHRGLWAAAHSARRVLWLKPGDSLRNHLPGDRAAALSLGLWLPLLNGATLVLENSPATFELLDADSIAQAHPESRYLLTAGQPAVADDRSLPFHECPEASGFASLSSPSVDFMNETQTGVKPGTLGRLPFGLELAESEGAAALRGPARFLRHLDGGEGRIQSAGDAWVEIPAPLRLNEQCFVELAAISAPQTSSTPPPHPAAAPHE